MELTKKALKAVRDSLNCRNRLAFEMEKSQQTIIRWLEINDEMLTTAQAMQIIREETGLTNDQILEQTSA